MMAMAAETADKGYQKFLAASGRFDIFCGYADLRETFGLVFKACPSGSSSPSKLCCAPCAQLIKSVHYADIQDVHLVEWLELQFASKCFKWSEISEPQCLKVYAASDIWRAYTRQHPSSPTQFYWKDIARGKEIMLYGTADTTEQLIREVDGTLIVRVKYKDDPKPVDLVEETFEIPVKEAYPPTADSDTRYGNAGKTHPPTTVFTQAQALLNKDCSAVISEENKSVETSSGPFDDSTVCPEDGSPNVAGLLGWTMDSDDEEILAMASQPDDNDAGQYTLAVKKHSYLVVL